MDRQIPIYFDSVLIADAPIQEIPNTNSTTFRLRVGAFYKYKNRNGSYITDEYAEKLIQSATRGNVPVIGFFDPETQDWASHTGPTLASAYGYVEDFLGWEPMTDTDGETREYAVFSVVIFSDYYEEARKIKGQNQSMEINPDTIEGAWADFDGEPYFVYTKGDMLGFCVIGSHEPCFSVSSFFSKKDDEYKTQYDKFSSLLSELKARVNEAEKGGEHPMDETQVVVEEESTVVEETPATEVVEEVVEPAAEEDTPVVEEPATDFEAMYNQLRADFDALQTNYDAAQARIGELETFQAENADLHAQIDTLQATIDTYAAQALEAENARKATLLDTYESRITDTDAFNIIKEGASDFSYEVLESKLAILFSNEQLNKAADETIVPLPEQPKSSFALLMEKYKKK